MTNSTVSQCQILHVEQTLGITRSELAVIVGCSYSSLQRLASGRRTEHVVGKEPEIIQMLVRITDAVVQLYQGDTDMAKHWMRMSPPGEHTPIKKMASLEKMVTIMCDLENSLVRLKATSHG